jgi:DNA mismatch endonuclease (patch repair protein)
VNLAEEKDVWIGIPFRIEAKRGVDTWTGPSNFRVTGTSMDHVSRATRSRIMASVGSRNTTPELIVRRALHRAGLRYRLHDNGLPGRPDIVFASRKLALFVHGCFWHRCPVCKNGSKGVRSNESYWIPKLARNAARDRQTQIKLHNMGWTVRIVWECQTKSGRKLNRLVEIIKRAATTQRR